MSGVPNAPKTLLDAIPDPETVRSWLAESIKQSGLLRSLLRVAQRKAKQGLRSREAESRQEASHAG